MEGWGKVVRLVCVSVLVMVCLCLPSMAFALREGRVYEQVSPTYKGGYGVAGLEAMAPDGESVTFLSSGQFAQGMFSQEGFSLYLARRMEGSGWATTSLSAPPTFGNPIDFSSNLLYAIASGSFEATKAGVPVPGNVFVLHHNAAPDTVASWEVAGGLVLKLPNDELLQKGLYLDASADLCHIFFGDAEGPLLPNAEGATGQLYDLAAAPAGGCRGDGSRPLRLLAVKNEPGEPEVINRNCTPDLGVGGDYGGLAVQENQSSALNAVSADGSTIFFTTGIEKTCKVYQLFARLDGERTVEVSRPASEAEACGGEVPCPGAGKRANTRFVGADELGSRVFFMTTAPLSGNDRDTGNDIYMAEFTCPEGEPGCLPAARELKGPLPVSNDSAHEVEPADVQGVVRMAPAGQRVYFVALGALGGVNAEGLAPVRGAENMYVYDSQTRRLAFIAELCTGPVLSGETEDHRCPRSVSKEVVSLNDTGLWGGIQFAQSNSDGHYLVFSTFARLREDDTDDARDIYRYDAQTGLIEHISFGEAGYDANGNNSAFDATIPPGGIQPGEEVKRQHEMNTRAISEDGTKIVFTSSEPLSPDATNGLANVYEWQEKKPAEVGEGSVSLVSSGSATTPDNGAVISPSGGNVFFVTSGLLVSQDTDESTDIYDARLGGGFPPAPVARQQCAGDECQGSLMNPAPLLVPGSVVQAPAQNSPTPRKATPKKRSKKAAAKRKKKGRARHKARRAGDRARHDRGMVNRRSERR